MNTEFDNYPIEFKEINSEDYSALSLESNIYLKL